MLKRCYFCKKIIWPWQREWLGTTAAHASCDYIKFVEDVTKLQAKGWMTPRQAAKNLKKRKEGYY